MNASDKLIHRCNEMDFAEQDQWLGDVFMAQQAQRDLAQLRAERDHWLKQSNDLELLHAGAITYGNECDAEIEKLKAENDELKRRLMSWNEK